MRYEYTGVVSVKMEFQRTFSVTSTAFYEVFEPEEHLSRKPLSILSAVAMIFAERKNKKEW